MNEDCSQQSCPVPNNQVQDYLNQYSLNQVVVKSAALSVIIRGVPTNIPAGQFEFPVNSQTQSPLTFQGCQSLISIPIPNGSSFAQIEALAQQMVNDAAAQQAQCDAVSQSGGNQPPPNFLNTQQSATYPCPDGQPLTIAGSLPIGVTQDGDSLVCAAGIFSSNISQSDANQRAKNFLAALFIQLFNSGRATCSGCTPLDEDGTLTVDSPASPCFGVKAVSYPVTVPSGMGLQISVTSDDFTPVILILDSNGDCFSDDSCAGTYLLPEGSWTVQVGDCDDTNFGAFHITAECGWFNTEQIYACPAGGSVTIAAGQYFSTASLAAANALALAAAPASCPCPEGSCTDVSCLSWTLIPPSTGESFATGDNTVTFGNPLAFFAAGICVAQSNFCVLAPEGVTLRFTLTSTTGTMICTGCGIDGSDGNTFSLANPIDIFLPQGTHTIEVVQGSCELATSTVVITVAP